MGNHTEAPANVALKDVAGRIDQPLELWDNTLRDGEQAPYVSFSLDEKLELAAELAALGLTGINGGFPAVSEYEREMVRRIMALGLPCEVAVLSRLKKEDIDAAASTGAQWLTLLASPSDHHLRDKLNLTEDALFSQLEQLMPYALQTGMKVNLALEDASRTPLPRLERFVRGAERLGARKVSLTDTVGILTPTETQGMIRRLRQVTALRLQVHFHNDLGMATANVLAALEAGADGADGTLLGIGERAGNAPLEEVAVALRVKYGRELCRLERLPALAEKLQRFAGWGLAPSKPIVGENVFSHESGIHVAGILKNPWTYQPYPPDWIGRAHRIIFGKHSGIAGLRDLLSRRALPLDDEQVRALLEQVKDAGQRKERLTEERVLAWARALLERAS